MPSRLRSFVASVVFALAGCPGLGRPQPVPQSRPASPLPVETQQAERHIYSTAHADAITAPDFGRAAEIRDEVLFAELAPRILKWERLPLPERFAVMLGLAKLSQAEACESPYHDTEEGFALFKEVSPLPQVLRADLDSDGDEDAIVVLHNFCFADGQGVGLLLRIVDASSGPTRVATELVASSVFDHVAVLDERRSHLWLETSAGHGGAYEASEIVAYDVSTPAFHKRFSAPLNLADEEFEIALSIRGKVRLQRDGIRIDYKIQSKKWHESSGNFRTVRTRRGQVSHRWDAAGEQYRTSYGRGLTAAELMRLFDLDTSEPEEESVP